MFGRFILLFLMATPAPLAAAPDAAAAGGAGYLLWPPFLLFALWWLLRGGRSRGGKAPYPKTIFLGALALTVLLFGVALGGAPNPVAALVAFFPWAPDGAVGRALLALLFFTAFAVVGTKLICGWGCPFGALQELLYEIHALRRLKGHQLPFLLTMPVRTLCFAVFLLVTVGGAGLYEVVDPFRIFGEQPGLTALAAAGVLLLLALVVYRPFCQLFCPFGWYSWFLERFSLFGIRIDRRTCIRCNACARACPLEAARGRLLASPIAADCFSCARCLRACPTAAIDYGWRWGRGKKR